MSLCNIAGFMLILLVMVLLAFLNMFPVTVLINIPTALGVIVGTIGVVMAANHKKFSRNSVLLLAGQSAFSVGIIVALIGTISLLSNLENPESIGPNLALALTSILYGAIIKLICDILRFRQSRFNENCIPEADSAA